MWSSGVQARLVLLGADGDEDGWQLLPWGHGNEELRWRGWWLRMYWLQEQPRACPRDDGE